MTTSWIQTHTGREFHYTLDLDTLIEQIHLDDICWALTQQCRFFGHTTYRISIAAHSLAVADLSPKQLRKQALLHDAAEAYIGDIPTPLKKHLGPAFHELEAAIERAIAFKFHLPPEIDPRIHLVDQSVLFFEKDLAFTDNLDWGWRPKIYLKPEMHQKLLAHYTTFISAERFKAEILSCE